VGGPYPLQRVDHRVAGQQGREKRKRRDNRVDVLKEALFLEKKKSKTKSSGGKEKEGKVRSPGLGRKSSTCAGPSRAVRKGNEAPSTGERRKFRPALYAVRGKKALAIIERKDLEVWSS